MPSLLDIARAGDDGWPVESAFDARGCLTAAGLAQLAGAAPGEAPPEMAAHVAGCARCQRRLLSGPDAGFEPAARRAQAPPPWRMVAVLVACVGLVFLAAWISRFFTTPSG
jgi:hypothetical protein